MPKEEWEAWGRAGAECKNVTLQSSQFWIPFPHDPSGHTVGRPRVIWKGDPRLGRLQNHIFAFLVYCTSDTFIGKLGERPGSAKCVTRRAMCKRNGHTLCIPLLFPMLPNEGLICTVCVCQHVLQDIPPDYLVLTHKAGEQDRKVLADTTNHSLG